MLKSSFFCGIILQDPKYSFDLRDIMEAILKTPGPVSTPKASKATKMSLNYMTTEQFAEAAKELQKEQFGTFMSFPERGRPVLIFLKKPPMEVEDCLRFNPGLCTAEMYSARYAKGSSKAIGFQLRSKLVAKKLVSADHFL